MSDEVILPIPNLDLPQAHFVLTQENLAHLHQDALRTLMAGIEKDGPWPGLSPGCMHY